MCYCCRKLEKLVILMRKCGRPSAWEAENGRAVGGRAPLIGSDRSDHISEPIREHGLPRPPTASHFRPPKHSASHIFSCDLSEPIRGEHGLSRTRPPMADRTLPGKAMRLAVKSVRWPRGSDCIARCA